LQVERLSAKFADFVIVANDIWLKRITRRAVSSGESALAMINYPDTFHLQPRPKPLPGAALTGNSFSIYPGTLNRHQGLDVAVEAMGLLRERMPTGRTSHLRRGTALEYLKKLVNWLGLRGEFFSMPLFPYLK
jgi:hypothetical protein